MRTLTLPLILLALKITAATGQESSTVQPYQDADAYKIYSLLLPQEEFYAFAKDALMIQQNAFAHDISGACLKQPRHRGEPDMKFHDLSRQACACAQRDCRLVLRACPVTCCLQENWRNIYTSQGKQ